MVVYLNNDGIASSLTEGNLKASAVWTFVVAWLKIWWIGWELKCQYHEPAELDWKGTEGGGSFLLSYCFCKLILEKECCCKAAFLKVY